jgi:hypothetical protein
MVCPDDIAQVLRIELSRKGSRADKIAEHHRELTAFGTPGDGRHLFSISVEFPDGAQKLSAIAKNDPKFLEILVGQVRKDREVDPMLNKPPRVFGHT